MLATDTDEVTRADLAEALVNLAAYAKRQPHVFGRCEPSRWDTAHAKLDALLTQYEAAS